MNSLCCRTLHDWKEHNPSFYKPCLGSVFTLQFDHLSPVTSPHCRTSHDWKVHLPHGKHHTLNLASGSCQDMAWKTYCMQLKQTCIISCGVMRNLFPSERRQMPRFLSHVGGRTFPMHICMPHVVCKPPGVAIASHTRQTLPQRLSQLFSIKSPITKKDWKILEALFVSDLVQLYFTLKASQSQIPWTLIIFSQNTRNIVILDIILSPTNRIWSHILPPVFAQVYVLQNDSIVCPTRVCASPRFIK